MCMKYAGFYLEENYRNFGHIMPIFAAGKVHALHTQICRNRKGCRRYRNTLFEDFGGIFFFPFVLICFNRNWMIKITCGNKKRIVSRKR